ncbi:suppressor of fused domain protein [Mycobacterium sp. URHD0025]|uniref:suppressor of fused domain protein n=1 Tax=Mycobacterium sp. URHD0025 TaxID=1298864 RepID=UPI000491AD74|nr:suppressor of fused domain protein [Mycobacterium sp. URHD0025]
MLTLAISFEFMSMDPAPGWDAIDTAFARLYPGLGDIAPHFGRTDARLPGQGIWGITAYPNATAPQPHWHLVTYGFSNVFESAPSPDDDDDIWTDFEWTFRVAADIDLTQPLAAQVPTWSVLLLQRLGDLVFSGSAALDVGHRIKVGGPITLGEPQTDLIAIMFGEDPQLMQVDTGFGRLRFVQLVGVTAETVAAAQSLDNGAAGTLRMLKNMAETNPLLITDINHATSR